MNPNCKECHYATVSIPVSLYCNRCHDMSISTEEVLDYCEECLQSVRDIFVKDEHRRDRVKWCSKECLDKYHIKYPLKKSCQECYMKHEIKHMIHDLCRGCDASIRAFNKKHD